MYGHPRSQLGTAGIGMPRPLQDDLRQESQESRIANTFNFRFAPVGEEAGGINRLSRTSSVASLPESSGNDSSFENLENQINALIKPLQDQITALTKQSSKLVEENLRSHKLLVEQGELIDKLTKNNEILEFRLAEQQKSFDQKLLQEKQKIEATAKSMEDFKPQIFSKLKQYEEWWRAELAEQTSKINANNEALHRDLNSLKSQTTATKQQCENQQKQLSIVQQNIQQIKDGFVPLYRWYNRGNGDHFYCTDPAKEPRTPDFGYTGIGVRGYVNEGITGYVHSLNFKK